LHSLAARSVSELPSAATDTTPSCRACLSARSFAFRNARCCGSFMHLNCVDCSNSSSSTKKLMLITSSFASPAYVIPAAVALE
jgi:hypothetical protein